VSQLLGSIEAVGGIADSGRSCLVPRWARSSSPQPRRGRSGEPGGKAQDSRQKGRMRMKVAEVEGPLGRLEREEGGKGASDGRRDVLIPRESGGRPVRAPCPMRRSRFPDAGLPSGPLLN
jgi:hypothetical protein